MRSLKQANDYIAKRVGDGLRMYKGEGYFYFDAVVGLPPESIYTNSIKYVTQDDIDVAIAAFQATG